MFVALYGLSVIKVFTCGFYGSNLTAVIAKKGFMVYLESYKIPSIKKPLNCTFFKKAEKILSVMNF